MNPQYPRIEPHYRAKVVPGHGAVFLSATEQIVLQGELYELVTPHLDGRPLEEICRQLHKQTSPAKVIYTIRKLASRGLVGNADGIDAQPADAYWSEQNLDLAEVRRSFAEKTVSVRGIGIKTGGLCALLETMSVRIAEEGDLNVVVVDHYLHRELEAINKAALAEGKPWLLIKPTGVEIWIGPVFIPGQTACWECLATRIRANNPVLSMLEGFADADGVPAADFATTPANTSIAWGLTANAIAGWVAGGGEMESLEGRIQSFDTISNQAETHELLKQPACPACGKQAAVDAAADEKLPPLILESRKKIYTEDGGHRSSSPEETIEKYRRFVSPICGAVTTLERSSPENDGLMHVYYSGNNIARGPQSLDGLRSDLRSSSAGKGMNDQQAKASALCEALERYSGLFRGDEPRLAARMADLGDAAINPMDCQLYSEKQYAEREERNATPSIYNYIPLPFDPERKIEWSPVWSLTNETTRYLPTAYCYFDYPQDCCEEFCSACSNGNAAGNSREEAILQGFLELVERDAVGIWWYNRLKRPGVDLDSIDEPYLHKLRDYLRRQKHTFWVLDLTTDLGIPVFGAVSRRLEGSCEQILFGFGAHFDRRLAIMRSVTELNQMLVSLIEQGNDDVPPEYSDYETSDWLKNATVENQPYLLPEDDLRKLGDYPESPWSDDLKEDILLCKSTVEQQGLEMLVLDQTREEIGLPVVKVIVPGLRHFWSRFAPGRLYDVPVKLGWREQPIDEDDLNPVPMFL